MSERSCRTLRLSRNKERSYIDAQLKNVEVWKALPAEQRDRRAMTLSLTVIKARLAELREMDEAIISHEDQFEAEVNATHDANIIICEGVAELEMLLAEAAAASATAAAASTAAAVAAASAAVAQQPQQQLFLTGAPALDTPPEVFYCDRLQYRSFVGYFNYWVSKRAVASDTDRFIALCRLLRGDAKALVEHLPLDDSSYKTALVLLAQNYGNEKIERKRIMSELLNLFFGGD